MIGRTNVGAGANLNFKVVAYPENSDWSQLSGSENEIAILTDTSIKSWYIQNELIASPVSGDVVILTSYQSNTPFSVVKKKDLEIYPIKVQQYDGTTWVEKESRIWLNETWVELEPYLFKDGDICELYTGGWANRSSLTYSGTYADTGTCTIGDTIYLAVSTDCWRAKNACSVNKVSFKNFNKITFHIKITGTGPGNATTYGATILLTPSTSGTASRVLELKITSGTLDAYNDYTMDTTAINEDYYIAIFSYNNCSSGGKRTLLTIDKIRLSN